MNSEHIIRRPDGTVLSRLESPPGEGPRELFWQDFDTSQATNHRYAVRYPSADAAARGAALYEAEAVELP